MCSRQHVGGRSARMFVCARSRSRGAFQLIFSSNNKKKNTLQCLPKCQAGWNKRADTTTRPRNTHRHVAEAMFGFTLSWMCLASRLMKGGGGRGTHYRLWSKYKSFSRFYSCNNCDNNNNLKGHLSNGGLETGSKGGGTLKWQPKVEMILTRNLKQYLEDGVTRIVQNSLQRKQDGKYCSAAG